MEETYPASIKEMNNAVSAHDSAQSSHLNGFSHRLGVSEGVYVDIHNNKIADTTITIDKPVVDLGEFYFVDFSNMVSNPESPTGEYPYVNGQYGIDRGMDINSKLLYYSINMQIYNPNINDNSDTTIAENCATIDLRLYDNGDKQLVSDALFTGISCSDPTTDTHIANKMYVDNVLKGRYNWSKNIILSNYTPPQITLTDDETSTDIYNLSEPISNHPAQDLTNSGTNSDRVLTIKKRCMICYSSTRYPIAVSYDNGTTFTKVEAGAIISNNGRFSSVQIEAYPNDMFVFHTVATSQPLILQIVPWELI